MKFRPKLFFLATSITAVLYFSCSQNTGTTDVAQDVISSAARFGLEKLSEYNLKGGMNSINVSELHAGIYFFKFSGVSGLITTRKIVIEK